MRHEEVSVNTCKKARQDQRRRGGGVRSIPGRPGNEPHSTRPDQAQARQTPMHDDFYFWKTKRCQQTHVRPHPSIHTYRRTRTYTAATHTCYTVYSTVALSPYHPSSTDASLAGNRPSRCLVCRWFRCLSVCRVNTRCLRINEAYMIENPALARYNVPCAKDLTSTNDHHHYHHHDSR